MSKTEFTRAEIELALDGLRNGQGITVLGVYESEEKANQAAKDLIDAIVELYPEYGDKISS